MRLVPSNASGQQKAKRTYSPGLRLPPGDALSRPLGVRGQVEDQLAADLVGGLE